MTHDPQVEAAMALMSKAAEGLIQGGFDRETVARGTMLAALETVHPIADHAAKAKWLREMAQGLELATTATEGSA
jgi:pyruvate/2-oxoglutarate dehydrogenase complex dihydrolipoamide acyltransferase (E2) component